MKKAQIKMFESVAVLVVFAFLVVFGMNFWFGIQKTSVEREATRATQLRVFSLGQKMAYLPELNCAISGIQRESCIDATKLMALKEVLSISEAQQYYFPVFGWSTIKIRLLFPPEQNITMTLYDNPLPKATNKLVAKMPITIYNPSTDTNGFGIVEVTSYAT